VSARVPAPNSERQPDRPEEVLAGKEMDFPYPSHALGISFLTLAAVPTAVGCSRQLIRLGLNRWGLAHLIEDAELVASELTTNAVKATGLTDPDAKWSDLEDLAIIHIRLLLFETNIIIEVWDRDPAAPAPAPQEAADDQESGRGLSIVTMLSTRWSYFLAPQGGKVVWADLAIPPYPLNDAGLPQRSRLGAAADGNQEGIIRDLDLPRRIHKDLRGL
jgi:anti-sigma regulatory factor (Ser/Thr protein kinase)